MRPKHPHAAESGVGKHTARESERAQSCAAGKERVANAHPQNLASGPQGPGAIFFSRPGTRSLPRRPSPRWLAALPMSKSPTSFPLWPDRPPGALGDQLQDRPTLTSFPPTAKPTGAGIIVFPGGAYGMLAPHEGETYAHWLAAHGIHAWVLQYRLGPHGYRHPAMLHDAARAVRTVRHLARQQKLDPARIGVMGSSAGGHLVATIITKFDAGQSGAADPIERESSRPDLGILCYPVITMQEPHAHMGSRENLLGLNPGPELIDALSAELHVKPDTSPAFIWHTVADNAVPVENALIFASALRAAGVPFALSIYENGVHGLGLGTPAQPAPPWATDCLFWLRERKFAS